MIKQVSDMLIVGGGCTDVCNKILSTFMFDNFRGEMLGEGSQEMKPKGFCCFFFFSEIISFSVYKVEAV